MTKSAMERAADRITAGFPVTILRRPTGQGPTAQLAVRRSLVRMDMLHLGVPVDDDVVNAIVRAIQIQRGDWNPADHPRNPAGSVGGGKFRSLTARIADALKTRKKDGTGDPLAGFDREQLRKTAVKLGLKLRRGASEAEIKKLLLDHADAGHPVDEPKPKALPKLGDEDKIPGGPVRLGKDKTPEPELPATQKRFLSKLAGQNGQQLDTSDASSRPVITALQKSGHIRVVRSPGGRAGKPVRIIHITPKGTAVVEANKPAPPSPTGTIADEYEIRKARGGWDLVQHTDDGKEHHHVMPGSLNAWPSRAAAEAERDRIVEIRQHGGDPRATPVAKKVAAPPAPTPKPAVKKAAPAKKATPLSALGADFKPIALPSKEARDREILGDKEYERRQAAKKAAPAKRAPAKKAAPAKAAPVDTKGAPPKVDGYTGPSYQDPPNVAPATLAEARDLLARRSRKGSNPDGWTVEDEMRLSDVQEKLPPATWRRLGQEATVEENFALFRARNPSGLSDEEYKADLARRARETFAGKHVAVRTTPAALGRILEQGKVKTQFETGASSGLNDAQRRASYEAQVFGLDETSTIAAVRPVYGYLMIDGERPAGPESVDHLSQYGQVQVVLKDHVRSRTTGMIGDSMDFAHSGMPSPVDNPDWQAFNVSPGGIAGRALRNIDRDYSSPEFRANGYAEAEIHGGVTLDDIAEVLLPKEPSPQQRAQLEQAGVKWRVLDSDSKAAPAKKAPASATPVTSAKAAPPKQPTPSVDAPKAVDGYTGPRYEPAPGVDARLAADLRERLRPPRPESWSRGYATRQVDSEYQSAEVKKLIGQVGVPAARRIALEADAETALARLVEFQRPPDPTLGPYDDLPPVTAAEMDHIKTEATRQLRQDFADKKVGVRVTAGSLEQILANGRFKTQFETRRSGGGYVPTKRKTAEESMFGLPADTDPKVRPIYGYLAMEGVQPTPDGDLLNTYGDVQVILRQSVRQRTTASIGDSLDWEVLPSPVDDPSWESFNGAAHSSGGMQLDYAGRRSGLYVEAQIHDGVSVGDIEEIVFPAKPSSAMLAMLADRGISWRVLEP